MKQVHELKPGKCIAVVKHGESIKHFDATYSEEHQVVFFVIPDYYEVIGYLQESEEA